MNQDTGEIDKFSALSAQWWDRLGPCKPLHDINPLRMQFIEQHDIRGAKMLDIGCGGGILSEALAAAGAIVTGIDLSEAVLEVAKLHLLESELSVTYRHIAVEVLAQESPGCFDGIVCMELLEHVPHPDAIVHAAATLLKPGGHCWVSTLNRNTRAFLKAILLGEYVLKLLPKGTHQYERFIQPSELMAWGRQVGLRCVDAQGIGYHPLRKTYYLTDQVDTNYLLHFVRE